MTHKRLDMIWRRLSGSVFVVLPLLVGGAAKAELIGYWPMDEGSGDTVADQSGNGFDGALQGSTGWTDGMFGGGLEFFGSGDHVVIPDDPILRFSDNDSFTAMAWIFIPENSGSGWRGIVNKSRDRSPWWGIWIDPQDRWVYGESGNFLRTPIDEGWHHVAISQNVDEDTQHLYVDGVDEVNRFGTVSQDGTGDLWFGGANSVNEWFIGILDEVRVYDEALTEARIAELMSGADLGTQLQAGDADQDLDFDQVDLVKVQIAAKYLTGQQATWGEGDWNGAPGGEPGNPPPGNGFFDQVDIIAALSPGHYLTGPYAAIQQGGVADDQQTSIKYDPVSGELAVDAPAGTDLTSINIDSAAGIFTGDAAQNLGGSFDNDADNNIFKATFGSSFGSLTFGNVAQTDLSREFVLNDLTVIGSLAGGGALGDVDLIYVPEPTAALLAVVGIFGVITWHRRCAGDKKKASSSKSVGEIEQQFCCGESSLQQLRL